MHHPICDQMVNEKELPSKVTYEANDNNCRYHPGNTENDKIPLLSQGMCPVAYLHVYPTLFALHLNQNKSKVKLDSRDLEIHCPLGSDGVLFKTYTTKIKTSFLDTFKQFFSKKNPLLRKIVNLVYPVELFGKNTHLEAVSEGQGCAFGIKKGDTFTFNLDRKDEFCPAAFNSVYPLLNTGKDNFSVGCPDHRTNVRFALSTEPPSPKSECQASCDSYSSKVKIVEKYGEFNLPIDLNQWYTVDEVIEASGIRCYSSFHVAFPYFYALYNGGQLGFLTGERNTAGMGCPNATYLIKYKVSKDEKGKYKYSCEKSHHDCPRKIEMNEDIIIDNFENSIPFYYGLYDLYTSLIKIESMNETGEVGISSMRGKTGMVWTVLNNTH
jgi:uncharacterized repeat protein (TIGR04076 family)